MSIYVFDVETFYDSKVGYSLKKMTTEQYVNDPRFHLFGFSVSRDGGKPHWVPEEKVEFMLRQLRMHEHTVVSHNAKFDMSILSWKYGVRPKRIVDTLALARGVLGNTEPLSLSALAERFGAGEKGDAVLHMDGVRHPSTIMMGRLIEYCNNDVDMTWKVYLALRDKVPAVEKVVIDLTIRMFTEPSFALDRSKILREIELTGQRRDTLLQKAQCSLADLRSDAKFARVLESLGVTPPKKQSVKKSEKAGHPVFTWAFAKSDPDFKAMLDHEDELVRWACEARLGLKSTIKESRAQRFLGVADRMGVMPVALEYYGAHTGRYAASSSEKLNAQNLPAVRGSKDPDAGLLRKALAAPEGHSVVVSDASQIEARIVAWLAGQDDLVEAFAQGRDVYSEMATKIYGRPVDRKKNKDDYIPGFLGKCVTLGCIEEGSLVLTDQGLVKIEEVTIDMRVWDGVEWVSHDGPVYQGEKEVIHYDSLTATPDHIVYLRDGSECRFDEAAAQKAEIACTEHGGEAVRYGGDHFNRACAAREGHDDMGEVRVMWGGEEDQPSQPEARQNERVPEVQPTEVRDEMARGPRHGDEAAMHEPEGSGVGELRGAGDSVQLPIGDRRGTVDNGESGCSQGHGARPGEQQRALRAGEPTLGEPTLECLQHPEGRPRIRDGEVQTSVPPCPVRGLHAEEPDSDGAYAGGDSHEVGVAVVQAKRRVWDILNAGPRNRYTVSGRLVHNCGYSMSFFKFGQTVYGGMLGGPQILFDQAMAEQLAIDTREFARYMSRSDDRVQRVVDTKPAALEMHQWLIHLACARKIVTTYRVENPKIPEYWATCGAMIDCMYYGEEATFGPIKTEKNRLLLPNGMYMPYKELERDKEGNYSYLRRKEGRVQRVRVYGGSLTENISQALAGAYVKEAMARAYITYGLRTVLQVHDEVVIVSPTEEADKALEYLNECMTTAPAWASGLPLASEGDHALAYGLAK